MTWTSSVFNSLGKTGYIVGEILDQIQEGASAIQIILWSLCYFYWSNFWLILLVFFLCVGALTALWPLLLSIIDRATNNLKTEVFQYMFRHVGGVKNNGGVVGHRFLGDWSLCYLFSKSKRSWIGFIRVFMINFLCLKNR